MASVDEWLAQIKLERYAHGIKEQGYDELEFLQAADEQDIADVCTRARQAGGSRGDSLSIFLLPFIYRTVLRVQIGGHLPALPSF
jgi:hypothetical protein